MDEEDRLRREAFARPNTPEDEARAEAALNELAARGAFERHVIPLTAAADAADAAAAANTADARSAADAVREPVASGTEPRASARRGVNASPSTSAPLDRSEPFDDEEPEIRPGAESVARPSRLWRALPAVAAGAAAALVIVVAVGLNNGSEPSSADAPTASPSHSETFSDYNGFSDDFDNRPSAGDYPYPRSWETPVAAVTTGSAVSAQGWFSNPQTDADIIRLNLMVVLDGSSTRLVPTNADPRRVWVAQAPDGRLCLVLEGASEKSSAKVGCATPEDFDSSGVTVSSAGLTAFWDGFTVKTTAGGPSTL